jgi:hypothetical protein
VIEYTIQSRYELTRTKGKGKERREERSRNRIESHLTPDADVPVKSQNIRIWTRGSERARSHCGTVGTVTERRVRVRIYRLANTFLRRPNTFGTFS